jgi:peptidyl-tRNA hydrolase
VKLCRLLVLSLCLALPLPIALRSSPAAAQEPQRQGIVQIVILNAKDVAKREKGKAVIAVADVFLDVKRKTVESIAEKLRTSLSAAGVVAVVKVEDIQLTTADSTRFGLWDYKDQELISTRLEPGSYTVISVDIQNVDQLVQKEEGTLTLWAGKALGMDLKGKVNEAAAASILAELTAAGVYALVSL